MKPASGLTMVEVLVVVAIIGILVAAGFGFNFLVDSYGLMMDTFQYVYVYADLDRRAMIGLRLMTDGIDDHRGLREAESAIISSAGSRIDFVDGQGVSTRAFYLSGEEVRYIDGAGNDEAMEGTLDQDESSITFSLPQLDMVEISLDLAKNAWGKDIEINASTSVRMRNY